MDRHDITLTSYTLQVAKAQEGHRVLGALLEDTGRWVST
jgi:hypothetical protein